MDYHDWRVGDQVVCIRDNFGCIEKDGFLIPTRVPMMDEVLTIARIFRGQDVYTKREGIFLDFVEIPRRQNNGPLYGEISWAAENFRKLLKKRTSIEVFEKMLRKQKEETTA